MVQEAVSSPLPEWESFYVIVGTSAAALTGLMFVVITLIRDSRVRSSSQTLAAFGTPTVVHFCVALLVSAIISAPWHGLANAALALGAVGLGGLAYGAIVVRRARSQTGYKPVLEDWLWHAVFPLLAYAAIVIAALTLTRRPTAALFDVAAATLLLVFIGIHNAWDTVTYVAVDMRAKPAEEQPGAAPPVASPPPASAAASLAPNETVP
jgi:hypothetical protein